MKWLLVLLAACGGSKRAAAPAPIDAAPGPDLEAELTHVEALERQACACRDVACLDEADTALAAYVDVATENDAVTGEGPWTIALGTRQIASVKRLTACFEAFGRLPARTNLRHTVRMLERFAEHACACTDDDCRHETVEALDRFKDMTGDVTKAAAFAERVQGAIVSLGRCLAPALQAQLDEAEATAIGLRDRACACADPACGQVVNDDLLAWIQDDPIAAILIVSNDRIREPLAALSRCWQQTTGAP